MSTLIQTLNNKQILGKICQIGVVLLMVYILFSAYNVLDIFILPLKNSTKKTHLKKHCS